VIRAPNDPAATVSLNPFDPARAASSSAPAWAIGV